MILTLNKENIPELSQLAADNDDPKGDGYWDICFAQQDEGLRVIFGWIENGQIIAYAHFNRAPKYQPFASVGIPEIQDLRVDRAFRQRGIATALIYTCEALAIKEGFEMVGIGVGLSSDYGKAQRLYVTLGYMPDGAGVNYDREICARGDRIILDDDLSLMMVKSLS